MKKWKLLVFVFQVFALGVAGLVSRPASETHDDPPNGPGVYQIVSDAGGCLGFSEDSPEKVPAIDCGLGQRTLFTFIKDGSDYLIRNGDVTGPPSGRCLDSDSSRNDDNILALACNRSSYQKWHLHKWDNGKYQIKNVDSGQCLEKNPSVGLMGCNDLGSWSLEYVRRN